MEGKQKVDKLKMRGEFDKEMKKMEERHEKEKMRMRQRCKKETRDKRHIAVTKVKKARQELKVGKENTKKNYL